MAYAIEAPNLTPPKEIPREWGETIYLTTDGSVCRTGVHSRDATYFAVTYHRDDGNRPSVDVVEEVLTMNGAGLVTRPSTGMGGSKAKKMALRLFQCPDARARISKKELEELLE